MNTHLQTLTKSPPVAGSVPMEGMALTRKCACGGSGGLSDECEGCEREKLIQRRAVGSAPVVPRLVTNEPLDSSGHSFGTGLRSFSEPSYGHDFGRVQIYDSGTIRFQGDTPKVEGKTEPNPKPKELKEKAEKQAVKITTPDGVDLGPTEKAKTFCLKSNSFDVKTAVATNSVGAAQGSQVIKFEGENAGKQDKKDCSCDCGVYRHWISGFMQVITPTQFQKTRNDLTAEFQKSGAKGPPTAQEVLARALANTPKIHNLSSCQHALSIQEGTHTEEYTTCIGDNDPDKCKWRYSDGPGATSGLSDGIYIRVNHPFKYEIWDACQGKSVVTKQATLSIEGDKAPRTISWS